MSRRWIYKIGGGEARIIEGDIPKGYQDKPWTEVQKKKKRVKKAIKEVEDGSDS